MTQLDMKPASSTEHRADIDGLRAIAVATVILFHYRIPGFPGGFVGVDVFFVISGFLMASIIANKLQIGRFSLTDFYLARARRIFPALAGLCAVLLLLGALSLGPLDYQRLALHAASALTFVSNYVFRSEAGYFDIASHEKWLLHTWSLSVEWQFYLLFPLLLMAAWTIRKRKWALIAAVTAAFLVSLAVSIYISPKRLDTAYYLLPARAWELLAGSLVFFLGTDFKPSRRVTLGLELAGIAMILAAAVLLNEFTPWPGYLGLLPVGGAVFVILAQNTKSIITSNPLSRFIGLASYSIYLWHWPVLVALRLQRHESDWLWAMSGIGVSILLGYLSFRWVEVPTRRKGLWRSKTTESLVMTSVAVLLVGWGLVVYRDAGFPSRLGPAVAAYEDAARAIDDWGHPGPACRKASGADLCYSPGEGGPLIMFIGDSITQELYPRYGERRRNRTPETLFLTRSGCPPLRDIDGYPPGKHCGQYGDYAWSEVRKRAPQKLIVAAAWWSNFYDEHDRLFGATCVKSNSGCAPVLDRAGLNRAFAGFEADVKGAVASGIHVFIVAPMPISRTDYPRARLAELAAGQLALPLARPLPFDGSNRWFSYDHGADSPPAVLHDLLAGVAERTGAKLVEPDQYLCPDGRCPFCDGSQDSIYKDAVHLRAAYIRSDAMRWLDRLLGVNG